MCWAHGRSGQISPILATWLERVIFILHTVDKQCSSKCTGGRDKIIIRIKKRKERIKRSTLL